VFHGKRGLGQERLKKREEINDGGRLIGGGSLGGLQRDFLAEENLKDRKLHDLSTRDSDGGFETWASNSQGDISALPNSLPPGPPGKKAS